MFGISESKAREIARREIREASARFASGGRGSTETFFPMETRALARNATDAEFHPGMIGRQEKMVRVATGQRMMEVKKPKEDGAPFVVAVGASSLPDGLCQVITCGAAVVIVDIQAEKDDFAGCVKEETQFLRSGSSGYARILSRERPGGTGKMRCLVCFPAGAVGPVRFAVPTLRPSGGGGPVTYQPATLDSNGNWVGEGEAETAIVPRL